ncbi:MULTISPECIES: alkaline phosphatase family protein [Halocynthiibacter]|uniref:Alkaline phosphatase family protein n=1 Tax=Halocynthiibacter halioticoli TaxID=2986804 RepID=A0AAE3J2Y2_9RHOB|nr:MULTISPECIES: alkaline phosphatase family protein [Halocynthiibacter]MCV6825935.1 alkaline phosphatase family protein [Halocynthiibacter halioticoli]MCW4058936.1 alkaline phosphatase family protein [Halocynthiibacter sp. SDUM655004]
MMPSSSLFPSVLKLAAICLGFAVPSVLNAQEKPRLVLQITVDQLRGDLIDRYGAHLGEGGFRYLLENGVNFTNTHHRHANTETIVGHTTLATGTDPAIHGMVANLWFDRKTGTPFYNVQDPDYPLVGASGIDADNEIDPTQRAATTDGRSPRNIISSTISDEIALHFGPTSKVFGVSVKDRGAIAMAGHAGEAYWFSKSEGRFVTSTFYNDAYPSWIGEWDAKGLVASYANRDWTLLGDASDYAFADRDDQPWETALPGFGRTFPHNWGPADGKYFTTFLTLSPAGDEITVDFAKALLDAEQLGQDVVTDYLSVSLSSTDYVGHIFGPSSLEAEDNFAHLDRQIAGLLQYVESVVGLEHTLVVLSADHGAPEHPDYLATLGIEAGLFDFERVDTEPGFVRLQMDFGESKELVQNFSNPYVYLNKDLISERDLDPLVVERAVSDELQKLPGIAYAVSSSDLRRGAFAKTKISDAVLANFNPDRSGDIYVVFEPHWFVADFDGLHVASAHGSPWTYDTHVPLIFSGKNIATKTIVRRVETVDVAPTIAAILGTKPPSGAVGDPLPEAMPRTKD